MSALVRAVAVGVGAAGGLALERLLVRAARRGDDPSLGDDFSAPVAADETVVPTSDGGAVHVVGTGRPDAPPVVLLHGITLSSTAWRYQLDDLAPTHRVLAVDQRGHGRSRAGDEGLSFERLAADLAEVLCHLDLHDAVVVGHSMGGMVVQRFAIDHPTVLADRVAAIVLVSTASALGVRVPLWDAALAVATPPSQQVLRWLDGRGRAHFPATDLSHLVARVGFGRRASHTHVELTRAMSAATPLSTVADLAADLTALDLDRHLGQIRVPVTVVVGSRDVITPPYRARQLAAAIPGAQLIVLPGAGHMPMLERRQELADIVRTAGTAA